jgi:hypothetical protein
MLHMQVAVECRVQPADIRQSNVSLFTPMAWFSTVRKNMQCQRQQEPETENRARLRFIGFIP